MDSKPSGPSLNIDSLTEDLPQSSADASLVSAPLIRKAFFIYGPTGIYMRDDRCQAPVEGMTAQPNRAPLDLAYMAAMLERMGVECRIRDYAAEKASWEDVQRDLAEFKPEMLVISVTTPTLEKDLAACRIAKKLNPQLFTVAKGAHFSPKDEEVLLKHRELDLAIRGESEHAIAEIVERKHFENILGVTYRKDGQLNHNPNRPYIEVDDLDKLPFPARRLLKNELYLTPDTGEPITMINMGRGCPHQCIYCAVTIASGYKLKVRSPKSVVDEIEHCSRELGIHNFFFRADTFTWDEKWTVDVCKQILSRNLKIRWGSNSRVDTISAERLKWMKKAGCWIIGFGIESGNQENLNRMKKRATLDHAREAIRLCKQYGIKSYGLFVVGLPWETRAMVEDTIRFMKELSPSFVDVNIAYPLPGTEYYRIAKEMKLFDDEELGKGDYSKPIVRTVELSTQDLIELRRKALLSFYMRPSYILQTLLGIRSVKVFNNYIKSGIRLLRNHAFTFAGAE
jgi:anaerobic magnesium-protoporphyrin IX monomethyl ester cyclase